MAKWFDHSSSLSNGTDHQSLKHCTWLGVEVGAYVLFYIRRDHRPFGFGPPPRPWEAWEFQPFPPSKFEAVGMWWAVMRSWPLLHTYTLKCHNYRFCYVTCPHQLVSPVSPWPKATVGAHSRAIDSLVKVVLVFGLDKEPERKRSALRLHRSFSECFVQFLSSQVTAKPGQPQTETACRTYCPREAF